MTSERQDLGERNAYGGDAIGNPKLTGDSVRFCQRVINFSYSPLLDAAALDKANSNLLQSHGALTDLAEGVEDREFLIARDSEGLFEIAAGLENVGDLAHGDGT
jgi:hypothetical protein